MIATQPVDDRCFISEDSFSCLEQGAFQEQIINFDIDFQAYSSLKMVTLYMSEILEQKENKQSIKHSINL